MLDKVRQVKALVGGRDIEIEVDGGIAAENARDAVSAGANVLVAGTSLFRGGKESYAKNIAAIRAAGEGARTMWA
jgi:ribulose-phosphate 3-epimerase